MKPVLAITHARFDATRRDTLARLVGQLRLEAPDIALAIACDDDRRGSLWCWKEAMALALRDPDVTHVVWLPDDAIVCRDFGAILTAAINARPDDVFDCYVNSTEEVGTLWWSCPDGYTGMGGVMPRALLEEHLAWRERVGLPDSYTNDGGVNLWAIVTGRRIFKTKWTLVDHDDAVPSLDGNTAHAFRRGERWVDTVRQAIWDDVQNFLGRTYMAPEAHAPGVATSLTELGRCYQGNHWDAVKVLPSSAWNVAAMYEAHEPTSEREFVCILVPCYRETEEVMRKTRPSREAVAEDLRTHGVDCSIVEIPGDSHVDRMRQRATHIALKSGATHLLWWDADIEALDPKCVRGMLMSGHDVVAGACPFKDDTKRVVCNLWPDMVSKGELVIDRRCLEVQDAGTGFMLVSRRALLTLMQRHPERLHFSRSKGDMGEPLWALWDAEVHEGVFLTEDYNFCRLWQEAQGRVYVYVPATFRHWGLYGYSGSLVDQYGLETAP